MISSTYPPRVDWQTCPHTEIEFVQHVDDHGYLYEIFGECLACGAGFEGYHDAYTGDNETWDREHPQEPQ